MSAKDRAVVMNNWQQNGAIERHYKDKGQEVPLWVKKQLTRDRLFATPKIFYETISGLASELANLGYDQTECNRIIQEAKDLTDAFDVLSPGKIGKLDPDGKRRREMRERENGLFEWAISVQTKVPGYSVLLDQSGDGLFHYSITPLETEATRWRTFPTRPKQ